MAIILRYFAEFGS